MWMDRLCVGLGGGQHDFESVRLAKHVGFLLRVEFITELRCPIEITKFKGDLVMYLK